MISYWEIKVSGVYIQKPSKSIEHWPLPRQTNKNWPFWHVNFNLRETPKVSLLKLCVYIYMVHFSSCYKKGQLQLQYLMFFLRNNWWFFDWAATFVLIQSWDFSQCSREDGRPPSRPEIQAGVAEGPGDRGGKQMPRLHGKSSSTVMDCQIVCEQKIWHQF